MRSRDEIKEGLYNALNSTVRKIFKKRGFDDNFTDEEMEKIKEIDSFIREVSLFKGEEILQSTYKGQFIFLCFKSSVKVKGHEISVFLNKSVSTELFDYEKIEYYVAKCIYRCIKHRYIEVYYTPNTFRMLKIDWNGNRYMVDRRKTHVVYASSVFMDIDLTDDLAQMENEELLLWLKKEYEDFFNYLPFTYAIRSGGGLHIYYSLSDNMDLREEEIYTLWEKTMKNLADYFKAVGGDIKVCEPTRILRLPYSINRKQKYGKYGKEVLVIEQNRVRYDLEDLNGRIVFMSKGGFKGVFEQLLDDMDISIYGEGDIDSLFVPVDFEDDFFTGEPVNVNPFGRNYLVSTPREEKEYEDIPIQRQESSEQIQTGTEESTLSNLSPKAQNTIEKINAGYKGIRVDYNHLQSIESDYQNRDILFYVLNRQGKIEGIRTNLLFIFLYNWICFSQITDSVSLTQKAMKINSYFSPPLEENEVIKQVKSVTRYLDDGKQHKRIRNVVILNMLQFTEEEIKLMTGAYAYDKESEELQRREKFNKYSRDRYTKKLQKENKMRKSEQREFIYGLFKKEPLMSSKRFFELTGLKVGQYIYYKQELGLIETREEKSKRAGMEYFEIFESNPSITYEEFIKIKKCSGRTFYKWKKRYFDSLM